MKMFNALDFKQHENIGFSTHARVDFDNGYGASVITGQGAYSDESAPYELAVFYDGSPCYTTPLTDDVIGHLTASGVDELLVKIAELPQEA